MWNPIHYRSLAVSLAALLTSACAMTPGEGTRAHALAMPSLEQEVDPAAVTLARQWPRAEWWRDFHDPELNRLVETALKDSPTLRGALARIHGAEALSEARAAEMLPSVGLGVEFLQRRFSATDFYGPNGGKNFTGANIDPVLFRYHLDLWGHDRAALEAALGRERAEASELAMARLLLAGRLARDYFRLCAALEQIDLSRALTSQAEDRLGLDRLRWERGLASRDPVNAGEQRVEAARQREARLVAEAATLRHRLAALAGRGPDWGNTLQPGSAAFAERFPLPEHLSLGLLAHRPDIAAALWRAEAAAQAVKAARIRFYPDINLVGFAGLHSLDLKNLFLSHGASIAYSMGPTLTLPLFEGGRLEAGLKNEQAAYDAAVEAYNAAVLDAARQVADGLARWRETLDHDAAQEKAVEAAETQARLAASRYGAGLGPRDGVIEAETALIEQRFETSQAAAERWQAAVDLIEALGGGYQTTASAIGLRTQP